MKKERINVYWAYAFLLMGLVIIFASIALAENTGSSGNVSLRIFDDTDSQNKYSDLRINFFSNFTNITGSYLNSTVGDGSCLINYNFTGSFGDYSNMSFNGTSLYWEANSTFNYKGTHNFEVNCSSDYGNISLMDNFIVFNTAPTLNLDRGGTFLDLDGNDLNTDYLSCSEDTICSFNFSSNVTEIDLNDVLTFANLSSNSTLTNFTLNSSTGILLINVTNDGDTGIKQIHLSVSDTESPSQAGILKLNISSFNDVPIFLNLENKTFNATELFDYVINVEDEENDVPFIYNISFSSCTLADWSTKTNCELFNSSQYSADGNTGEINISFTPTMNDVGSYDINFSVTDSGSPNATISQIVNFTVSNINSPPYFRYTCDDERNTSEGSSFSCYINVTDIDEVNNLTIISNESWFTFNGTGVNSLSLNVNSSTQYNASFMVNFTSEDIAVGNWSINLTVSDTGSPLLSNSTLIWFFVENVNDSVSLNSISDITAYTTNNYTIYVNATDDDLLITHKETYNESLVFSSNASWVDVDTYQIINQSNITTVRIQFDPNDAPNGAGNYSINISVNDANNYSFDSSVFVITVIGNTQPSWNSSTVTVHELTEDIEFYLNLSLNVSDSEEDALTFTYYNDTSFPSFSLNTTTGVINFTPLDSDVGQHMVTINVSDSAISDSLQFNFTISNINDLPVIQTPLNVANASVDLRSNINASEDNVTIVTLWVHDDDFRIPSGQKNFYNESINVSVYFEGPNTDLFSFNLTDDFPAGVFLQRVEFDAIFTPNKSDIGLYNVSINITDSTGNISSIGFNLSIQEVQHGPSLSSIENQSSKVNASFAIDINATDEEDGSDSDGVLEFVYSFLNGTDFINNNLSIFNTTTGVLNITFNDTQGGSYQLNISVNDSSGLMVSRSFWIDVYDTPSLNLPNGYSVYNLTENVTGYILINTTHSVNSNLTYLITYQSSTEYNSSYFGNENILNWSFTPNYTQETYGNVGNASLFVYNSLFPELNLSQDIGLNVSHANAPVEFVSDIPDRQATSDQSIVLNLTSYFLDHDYMDQAYNQTVNFTSKDNSSVISASISGWILTISASGAGVGTFNVTGEDINSSSNLSLSSAISNNFIVEFTSPSSTTTTSSGGGGSSSEPAILHLIVPGPVSVVKGEDIILPIQLVNGGTTSLRTIKLFGDVVFRNGSKEADIDFEFDQAEIKSLSIRESKDIAMKISTANADVGFYEITINATVSTPKFSDWNKIYITVQDPEDVLEKLLFTQELFAENPECLELNELILQAENLARQGQYDLANEKISLAIQACRDAISQRSQFLSPRSRPVVNDELLFYLVIATVACFGFGFIYYIYRRRRLKKAISAYLRKL